MNSLIESLKYDPKFTHDAYDRYKQNYAYLADNSSLLGESKMLANNINGELDNGISVNMYDKYLTTDTHDKIMGVINNTNADTRLSSRIIKDIHDYKLEKNINDINNIYAQNSIPTKNNTPELPKAFKNHDTSNIINIDYIKSSTPGNPVNPNDKKPFIIYANDGCLQYNVDANTLKTNLSVAPCRATNINQQFFSDNIDNKEKYNSYFQGHQLYNVSDSSIFNLGYYIVRPNNSDNNCIVFSESGLSVQPCDMSISQKFSSLNNHVSI
jgi:hypothetical protein